MRANQTTANLWIGEQIMRWARRRGPAFSKWRGPWRSTYLIGPEANAFIFGNDDLFRVNEAFRGLTVVDGETALAVSDGELHTRLRSMLRPSMHVRQVNSYMGVMADSADRALDRTPPGAPFDLYAAFRSALRHSTMRSLFGDRIATLSPQLGRDYQPLLEMISLPPQLITLHQKLGTPRWRRCMRARARIDATLYGEIARTRRTGPDDDTRVLTLLAHGRDEKGSGLSDTEVRDQVASLIAAGYETVSGAMAWAVYELARNPGLQRRVREEVMTVTGGEAPSAENLRNMPLLGHVVTETLRLYPPTSLSARFAAEAFDFAGLPVPAGEIVVYSPYATHRDPAVFERPREFLPERWADGVKRGPHEYLPFGGGTHRCIGASMATTELATMLSRILVRGVVRLESQKIRGTSHIALHPRGGLRVRIHPAHQKSSTHGSKFRPSD